ncbi:protein LAX PANICLE 2-like [Hibiscus syriacus]|uniref:protein LAX PANICLE 2-like n=1 Tax=Hibiscus syriacus TaxID=106335 RepID=UPI0019209CFE|nr:protein LAX PANICLE 2-like [Hibiscus syriacus]
MAWWWPCHDMSNLSSGSLNDWQMSVPNNHHDYSRRTRPHSDLWFTLHSYTNRNGEALPQIPKAYIRVKDENVTIFMVKKYLVTKLGVSNEAEVEILCMGQRLLQTQTLKQVRDFVWMPSFVESESFHSYSLQSNCVNNHLMSLFYGRRCSFN